MSLDDLSHDGEPKPASLLLCGEEGIEYFIHILGTDTASRIFNFYSIGIPRLFHLDVYGASILHGMNGIYQNV
jgi:hypothetical protein